MHVAMIVVDTRPSAPDLSPLSTDCFQAEASSVLVMPPPLQATPQPVG